MWKGCAALSLVSLQHFLWMMLCMPQTIVFVSEHWRYLRRARHRNMRLLKETHISACWRKELRGKASFSEFWLPMRHCWGECPSNARSQRLRLRSQRLRLRSSKRFWRGSLFCSKACTGINTRITELCVTLKRHLLPSTAACLALSCICKHPASCHIAYYDTSNTWTYDTSAA